jgi:hypothetical protein
VSAGTVPRQTGPVKDLGPISDAYHPAAPSQQETTESLIREILSIQRARRMAAPDQRFHLLRDEMVEWLAGLEGLDPGKQLLSGYADIDAQVDEFLNDLRLARGLVAAALLADDPAADYPLVKLMKGDASAQVYQVKKSPGVTAVIEVAERDYDSTMNRWVTLDERKKYLEAVKRMLGPYADIRGIAAKWGLWNMDSEVHATTAAYSMKSIEAAIDSEMRSQARDSASR